MASPPIVSVSSSEPPNLHAFEIGSIKAFAEDNRLSPIPSFYYSIVEAQDDVADHLASSISIIDFSLLISDHPQLHADAVSLCLMGFFHGHKSWDIREADGGGCLGTHPTWHKLLTSRREGSLLERSPQGPHIPTIQFPTQTSWEVAYDYSRKIRAVARTLLQGISESLGLESKALVEYTGFDSGLQVFIVNLYPPCPQPELALGLPPHTDQGLLTLLYQNGIGGLQVNHDGKWINVNPLPNCLIVNIADQLEVVSNGKYKIILHRAILNNKCTRMSIPLLNGPEVEKEIGPVPELVEKERQLYKSIKYRDYFRVQQQARLADKSVLDEIRLNYGFKFD
ncbi:hypothetical protein K1719_024079 [Acacia pycnantha]|nr:hypothetical protein K1719_024079 [Acacia pycnantha]